MSLVTSINCAFHGFEEEGMVKSCQKVGFRRPDESKLRFDPFTHGDLPWPKEGGPGNTGDLWRRHEELNEK